MNGSSSRRPRSPEDRLAAMALAEIRRRYFGGKGTVPPPRMRAALRGDARAGAAALLELARSRVRDRRRRQRRRLQLLRLERGLWRQGVECIAGVDEAGMGPLAGPVVAAAVILPRGCSIEGLDDSKVLSVAQRLRLETEIRRLALAVAVGRSEPAEIDTVNIYQAGLLAMGRAVAALTVRPEHLLVDARRVPGFSGPQQGLIHGDALSASIAAASVIAKVTRDRIMEQYDRHYPGYGFASHKGYATAAHRQAMLRQGTCHIHRKSFVIKELKAEQRPLFPPQEMI